MTKVSFANMKLKPNTVTQVVDFEGNQVEVLQYLPAKDKDDLIRAVLDKSSDGLIFDDFLLDCYFHLYIVYLYTNINFTDKQKEDELKLYDLLKGNGLIDAVLGAMDEEEYQMLFDSVIALEEKMIESNTSAVTLLARLVTDLPEKAEEARKIVDEFEPEKYQAVVDFAKAANGDRPIPKQ
jgi:hypothetical protein